MPLPASVKRLAGLGLGLAPHARHERCVYLLGHMRCGSTALANVLCAHPDISGYGESHVEHGLPSAPGRLVLNQIGARRWKPGARMLFDKILHDALDAGVGDAFFTGRAIFLTRDPEPAIASIVTLFASIGSREYPDAAAAAAYYVARLRQLSGLWRRFPPERRLALRHETLVGTPAALLERVTTFLDLDPPLRNAYVASPSRRGAGDPVAAPHATSITVSARSTGGLGHVPLAHADLAAAKAAHAEFLAGSEP